MKKLIGILGLATLVIFWALPIEAAEFITPTGSLKDVNIPAGQTHINLYTAGRSVNINGPVGGDLYAAGSVVNLNAAVQSDFNAASGSIVINAPVGGDARLVGGTMNINASISGDLVLGGGTVNITSASSIGGDLIAGSGEISVDAPVAGQAKISGGNIRINSRINGPVTVRAVSLTFGPSAVVAGPITYFGSKEAVIEEGAQVSSVNFTHVEHQGPNFGKLAWLAVLVQLIGVFVASWFLTYLSRGKLQTVLQSNSATPLPNLGIGIAVLILAPVICLLLFLTLVGYYFGLILGFAYVLFALLAYLVAVIFTGAMIRQFFRKGPLRADWLSALIGVVVIELLSFIPFLGWAVIAVLFFISFGSLLRTFRPRRHDTTMADEVINPNI